MNFFICNYLGDVGSSCTFEDKNVGTGLFLPKTGQICWQKI